MTSDRLARVIDIRTRKPLDSEEHQAAMLQELADLDMQCEETDRRREQLRRCLGLLGVERGLDG